MTEYPERLPRNNCAWNSHVMVLLHPELSFVEGYLVFTSPDGSEFRMEHCWNAAPDGRVVDSTIWAVDEAGTLPYRYEPDPQAWARLGMNVRVTSEFIERAQAEDSGGDAEP